MKRRLLSLLLAMVLAVSLALPAFAQGEDGSASVDTSQVHAEGTNDVGVLLADELQKEPLPDAGGDHISDLTVETDGEAGTASAAVTLAAGRDADVVVAVYGDDRSHQMLATGSARVPAGAKTAEVSLTGTVPEYFVVSAFLLDPDSHEPLCEEYTNEQYTKAAQDILDTTVDNFDPEQVLNLDAQENTNFLVYSDDTSVIEPEDGKNILTDNGDGTYTVTNADETFTSLRPGDTFSYRLQSGGGSDVILVKVGSVTVEGTTVTITKSGQRTRLDDFFKLVKIEVGGGSGGGGAAPAAADIDGSTTGVIDLGISLGDVTLSGTMTVSAHFQLYMTAGYHYVELTIDSELEGALSVSADLLNKEIPLPDLKFYPVPGLSIGVETTLFLNVSGQLALSFTLTATNGLAVENWQVVDKNTDPEVEFGIEGTVTAELGLKVGPFVELLEGLAKLSANVGESIVVEAVIAPVASDENIKHDCSLCVQGTIKHVVSLTGTISLAWDWVELEASLRSEHPLGEFYCSNRYGFGLGSCPGLQYKVTLTIKDADGAAAPGTAVQWKPAKSSPAVEEGATSADDQGVAVFYLGGGTYDLTLTRDAVSVKLKMTVSGQPVKKTVRLAETVAGGDCSVPGQSTLKWSLLGDGTLRIEGTGKMNNYGADSGTRPPWRNSDVFDVEQISRVEIGDGVTTIGNNAFYNCVNLEQIDVPSSVTSIGAGAFRNCSSLTQITIPDSQLVEENYLETRGIGSYTFAGCSSLTQIVIPDSLTSIGEHAFEKCSGLTTVHLPESLRKLGAYAFSECSSLTGITIPDSLISIGNSAFEKCGSLTSVRLPGSLTSIGQYAFRYCGGMTSIDIPGTVTTIESGTFSYCSGLTQLTIPEGVTVIGRDAFYYCSGLVSISIPASVTSIEAEAFAGCSSLASVTIPDTVTSIGYSVFQGCKRLSSVSWPANLTAVPSRTFAGCSLLPSITLPEGVTSIGAYAFEKCGGLLSVGLPESLTSIGDHAFTDCSSLPSIRLPSRLESIGQSAFLRCYSLEAIRLPDSVTSMGTDTFSDCTGLISAELSSGLTVIEERTFDRCSRLPSIRIPEGITEVKRHAFNACYSLAWIGVPASMAHFRSSAFQDCSRLTDIYYASTAEKWGSVDQGGSDVLFYAAMHYGCTSPEEEAAMAAAARPLPEPTAEPVPEATEEPLPTPEPTPEATAEPLPTPEPAPEATAEPTPEPVPEPTEEPVPEATAEPAPEPIPDLPEETGAAPIRATQQPPAGEIVLVAAFEPGTAGDQYASFRGLKPGADYAILVVKDLRAADLLAAGNLLYITQVAAGGSGGIDLSYVPRTDEPAQVRAYGPDWDPKGDPSGDGHIDLKDVTMLYQHVHGQGGVAVGPEAGDVTGDGAVTAEDVHRLFRFVTGEIGTLT